MYSNRLRRNDVPLRIGYLRVLFMMLALFVGACSALAQDGLGVKWIKAGDGDNFVYSGNGAFIFAEAASGINVYRASDSKLLQTIPLRYNSGIMPVNDGSAVYYQTGRFIWRYTLATRLSTLIWDENNSDMNAVSLSADNSKIALCGKTDAGLRNVAIIDPILKKQIKRFTLPAGYSPTYSSFCVNDTRLVLDGMKLYGLDGKLIASAPTNIGIRFVVNPDRTRVFGFNQDNTVCMDLVNNLNVIWSRGSTGLGSDMKCSSDGKYLVFQFFNSFGTAVLYWNASDGLRAPGGASLPGVTYTVFTAPLKNEFLVRVNEDPDQAFRIRHYAFNTANGDTTRLDDLGEGFSSGVYAMGNASNPRFFTETFLQFHYLRQPSDGALLGTHLGGDPGRTVVPAAISPNGDFYVKIEPIDGVLNVAIHRYDTTALVSAVPFPGVNDNNIFHGWGNDSRLYAWNATTKRLRTYSFDGTTLLKMRDFLDMEQPAYGFGMSPDGTKLLQIGVGSNSLDMKVYKTLNGALLGTVAVKSPGSVFGILYWTFAGNLWVTHEFLEIPGGFRNQMRLVDLSKPDFPTIANPGYNQSAAPFDTGTARITPDASMVIFSVIPPGAGGDSTNGFLPMATITMVRVSDGAVVKSFSNLIVGTGGGTAAITADGATYIGSNYGSFFAIAVPPIVSSFTVNPTSVPGGQNSTGTVNLNIPAGPGGTVVGITAPGLGVPASVTVPEGQKTVNFIITTGGVDAMTVKTVTATLDGLVLNAQLTVLPASHAMLHFDPASVQGGTSSSGTVMLDALAGPSGVVVTLASDKSFVTVPGSVTVSSGSSTAVFTAQTVDPGVTSTAIVTATVAGNSSTAPLEVKSEFIVNIDLMPGTIKGGNAAELVVNITPTPTVDKTFKLAGNNLIDAPVSITIPAGKSTVSMGIKTKPTATDAPGTLTVSNDIGFSKTLTITVLAPTLFAVMPTLTSVTGATTVPVVVLLDSPAPASFSFAASSTVTGLATIPATVTVPEGANFVVVNVTVKKQTIKRSTTIKIGNKSFVLTGLP